MGSEVAVEVRELEIRYGEVVAVAELSFTARQGEILALLGPNGAGKTSTVECLEGYRRPSAGSARVLGLDPIGDHAHLVPRIGVMLQEGGVPTGIRPIEVLAQYAGFFADPLNPEELLDRVGLSHRRAASWRRLSGGEQQRLSLALALIGRPAVAFLDEPTAGVDPAGRQDIRRIIAELRDDGVCVVLTTHDLDEAQRLADQVVIIDQGRCVAAGSPEELMRSTGIDEIRFGGPPGVDVDGLATVMEAAVHELAPGEYQVARAPDPAAIANLTAWLAERELPLADLRAGRKSLEDVFLALTSTRSTAEDLRTAPDSRGQRRGRRSSHDRGGDPG